MSDPKSPDRLYEFSDSKSPGSMYKFSEVEAKTAKPNTINMFIKDVLRAKGDSCYTAMEPFLMPPGTSGSKSFDQAYAVDVLLRHDVMNGSKITQMMESKNGTRRWLWDRLQSVLRQVGFQMRHGRMIGILEDLRTEEEKKNGTVGQPDID